MPGKPLKRVVFKDKEGNQKQVGTIWLNESRTGEYESFSPNFEETEFDMPLEDALYLFKEKKGFFFVNDAISKKDREARGQQPSTQRSQSKPPSRARREPPKSSGENDPF